MAALNELGLGGVEAVLVEEPGLHLVDLLNAIGVLVHPHLHVGVPNYRARVNNVPRLLHVVEVNGSLCVEVHTHVLDHDVAIVSVTVNDSEAFFSDWDRGLCELSLPAILEGVPLGVSLVDLWVHSLEVDGARAEAAPPGGLGPHDRLILDPGQVVRLKLLGLNTVGELRHSDEVLLIIGVFDAWLNVAGHRHGFSYKVQEETVVLRGVLQILRPVR